MPSSKDFCPGCEDLRPLLHQHRLWRDDPTHFQKGPVLTKEDTLTLVRFIKHWPSNPHFVNQHLACFVKSGDDVDALYGLTLSFVNLGIQYSADCLSSLEHQCKRSRQSRQSFCGTESVTSTETSISDSDGASNRASLSTSPCPRMLEDEQGSSRSKVSIASQSPDSTETSPSKQTVSPETVQTARIDCSPKDTSDSVYSWTSKEIEDFCGNYHKVFQNTYPLFGGKWFGMRDERNKGENHFPSYWLDIFSHWVMRDGLTIITNYFTLAQRESPNLTEACHLVYMTYHVRQFACMNELYHGQVGLLRANVINYLLTLPLEDFRKPQCRHIADVMWNLCRDLPFTGMAFDLEGLNLAYKFFGCSSYLALRLVGINEFTRYINTFNDLIADLDHRVARHFGGLLANWILERKIVEEVFGQNAHVELISRSVTIINFLSTHLCLTLEHVDCIWNAAQMNYISRHVWEMLPNILRNMEPVLLMHLYKKLRDMDVTHHSEQTVHVITTTLRCIWSYAVNQKCQPIAQIKPLEIGVVRPVTDVVVAQRHRKVDLEGETGESSSENASGSSGSGSDEDSNSDAFDSDEDTGVSGASKIPAITTLYARIHPAHRTTFNPKQLRLTQEAVNGSAIKTALSKRSDVVSPKASDESDNSEEEDDEDEDGIEPEMAGSISAQEKPPRLIVAKRSSPAIAPQKPLPTGVAWCTSVVQQMKQPGMTAATIQQLLASPGPETSFPGSIGIDVSAFSALQQMVTGSRMTQVSPVSDIHRAGMGRKDDDVDTQCSDIGDVDALSTSDRSDDYRSERGDIHDESVESVPEDVMDDDEDMETDIQSTPNTSFSSEECKIKAMQLRSQAAQIQYANWNRRKEIDYSIEIVAKPGQTLLWDLVQGDYAVHISSAIQTLAEQELINLVIGFNNTAVALKFVEACVANLAAHQAVCASLRIMTKLIQQFQNSHPFVASGRVVQVMDTFFKDLKHFADNPPQNDHIRTQETRVRLQFLQTMYSNTVLDKKFSLTGVELETLWECLICKLKMLDELSHWFLQQLGPDSHGHALNPGSVQQLFRKHLVSLDSSSMTTTALKLYQLCLQSLTNLHMDKQLELRSECANRVWQYAMFGEHELSDKAIQHLNTFYIQAIQTQKDAVINIKERELFEKSMEYITAAMEVMDLTGFTTISRCFSLMKKQIESYRQRYGFHLRLWQLVGCGILSHNCSASHGGLNHLRNACFIHVHFQHNGAENQITLNMMPNQYFGELRADILYQIWNFVEKQQTDDYRKSLDDLYHFAEMQGLMHVTFRSEEVTSDHDEADLHSLGFRQESHVFVVFGIGPRGKNQKPKEKSPNVLLPPPHRETVPMLLAASSKNFEIFFQLLERLNETASQNPNEPEREALRKSLFRSLWEFLMLIPTWDRALKTLQLHDGFPTPTVDEWKQLLPENNVHRLLYALQALENLFRDPNAHGIGILDRAVPAAWADRFIASGGFSRLYELLLAYASKENVQFGDTGDSYRDCLSSLIRMIHTFSTDCSRLKIDEDSSDESSEEEVGTAVESGVVANRKRKSDKKNRAGAKKACQHPQMRDGPRFKATILEILDTSKVVEAIMKIQYDSAISFSSAEARPSRSSRILRQNIFLWGFDFLSCWAACNALVSPILSRHGFLTDWLRRLTLEASDSAISMMVSNFIERLCRVEPEYELSCALLVPMISMMSFAETIRCLRSAGRDDKAPNKPSPRHFYETISKLLEIIPNTVVVDKLDLDSVCAQLANSLESRPCLEPRHGIQEDDGLVGLLKVSTKVLSHDPPFKFHPDGMKMLITVFNCLFEIPCLKNRDYPKCKSTVSRMAAYECLLEFTSRAAENYMTLGRLLMKHHVPRNCPLWDYWPRDDMRSESGYVGITNLGATCYMATTMQHLYMIPEARRAVLEAAPSGSGKQPSALYEMQKIFAFLMESERKAYSPEAFCRAYEMNNQMLNPTEQKDMMEFFSDLVANMEEMSPSLKQVVRRLFTGKSCSTVVSLDCCHVSQTTEDFTTIRCQVNNMRSLYESLNDVCVKDVLEGNNMYKCGQCNREVRAEKRTCFRSLPEILAINTLRYTFNMITMQREKVNTHFSFPHVLDMSNYMEENIYRKVDDSGEMSSSHSMASTNLEHYRYHLIGVTVHTGTAEGGHYYSFIRDLEAGSMEDERWLLFNDAEVRNFEPDQLASECFGGDQPKPFEHSASDRYMDFAFEKTNSAYMLFYQRTDKFREHMLNTNPVRPIIPKELQAWVFKDTTSFVNDLNIFDRCYFDFLWRLCNAIPQTSPGKEHSDSAVGTGQLALNFLWETLVHARDRTHFSNFFDLTVKLAVQNPSVAEWFVRQMVDDNRFVGTILVNCPISNLRTMFQRFVVTLMTTLGPRCPYFECYTTETAGFLWSHMIGKLCRLCLTLLGDNDVRIHWRNLSEMMQILLEFAKLGGVEAWFLTTSQLFSHCFHFYYFVRQLKEPRNPLAGPLPVFPFHANLLEMAMLDNDDPDYLDRFSPELDKDKPNSLSLMVYLLRHCVESFQGNVFNCKLRQNAVQCSSEFIDDQQISVHSSLDDFLGNISDHDQMEFIATLIRDGVEPHQTASLAAVLYFDKPEMVRACIHFIVQKVLDLSRLQFEPMLLAKKERDRDNHIRAYLTALGEIVRYGEHLARRLIGIQSDLAVTPATPNYTEYLFEKLISLVNAYPTITIQWLSDNFRLEAFRQWVLDNLGTILGCHGMAVEKPVTACPEELQQEVSRLIVSMAGDQKLRDSYSYTNGALYLASRDKQANTLTALDKSGVVPIGKELTECHQIIKVIVQQVMQFFQDLMAKYPTCLDGSVSNQSYQWILFAVQFLMIDDCIKQIILDYYALLRSMLLLQLVPDVKNGSNRQAILQLLATSCYRFQPLCDRIIVDTDLVDRLLADVKIRGNEEPTALDNEGRFIAALFLLLNQLCLQNSDFAIRTSHDRRLLDKLQLALNLKIWESSRRAVCFLIGTLINEAPYPEGEKSGEEFRRNIFDICMNVRAVFPFSVPTAQIARRVMEGADDAFQLFVIENKGMDYLTDNFKTFYSAFSKALTFMYDEAQWTFSMLRRLKNFAVSHADSNPKIKEALNQWMIYARQSSRDMNIDIIQTLDSNSPFEISRHVVPPKRR